LNIPETGFGARLTGARKEQVPGLVGSKKREMNANGEKSRHKRGGAIDISLTSPRLVE